MMTLNIITNKKQTNVNLDYSALFIINTTATTTSKIELTFVE